MYRSKLSLGAFLFFSAIAFVAPSTPAAFAAADSTAPSSGTLMGAVTCGPDEDQPAARALVQIDGLGMSTAVAGNGQFTLTGVPTTRPLTITATSDANGARASRYNVTVHAGETLDIGSLDLSVCPSPDKGSWTPFDTFDTDGSLLGQR